MGEPPNPELLALIADSDLHAPALLDYEVANALRGHALAGRPTQQRLAGAVDDFGALHIDRYPVARLMESVLDLKENFTVYDAAAVVSRDAVVLHEERHGHH